MRVSREHPPARSITTLTLGVSLGVVAAMAPAGPSGAATGAVPSATPSTGSMSAAGPEVVSPGIDAIGVPRVGAKAAKTVAERLSGEMASPDESLVAHLSQPVTDPYSMVGVTWDHGTAPEDMVVQVRTRDRGPWSEWAPLHVGHDDDLGNGALERDGTEPVWVGEATGVEVAVYSDEGTSPGDLEVQAIDPGTSPYDATALTAKSGDGIETEQSKMTATAGSFPSMPRIISRRGWGADESLGDDCWSPIYGKTFKSVVVHHTVGSNSYRRSESAAIVRGIYAYHTQSRGWCDIGYNFLIDRYGRVFEGRDGGIRHPVRGAHAGDYNLNTTGISLMGNFETARPTRRMKTKLVSMIAWRMGTAYHGAYGKPFVFDRKIKRITGHRDVMSTACPGRYVYGILRNIRRRVDNRLGESQSAIEQRWRALADHGVKLGQVRMGEHRDGVGRWTRFQTGRIYKSKAGVKMVPTGAVMTKYTRSGHVKGALGYPKSALRHPGRGTYVVFYGGRIYWSKRTKSHVLYDGPILQRYRDEDETKGKLGFPDTNARQTKRGTQVRFEHGWISWNRETGRTRVTYS